MYDSKDVSVGGENVKYLMICELFIYLDTMNMNLQLKGGKILRPVRVGSTRKLKLRHKKGCMMVVQGFHWRL